MPANVPEGAPVPTGLTSASKRTVTPRRIGDVVVELGYADRETVEKAVEEARAAKVPTGKALLDSGMLTTDQLARAVAERYGTDHVDLNAFEVDPAATSLVEPTVCRRYRAAPIAFTDARTLLVATADPANILALDDLGMMTGYDIRSAVASPEDLEALLSRLSRLENAVHEVQDEDGFEEAAVIELRESAADAPVVKLVHSIVADAVERGASDIHFDPQASEMKVRMRIDGVVTQSTQVPRAMVAGLVSRIKIMAELDISERRVPQDGRIGLTVDGRYVDIRVATLPIVRGEAVVMRILDKGRVVMDLDKLGMSDYDSKRFREAISETHGSIVVTGPTGSGKSTTLYAALTELNTPEKSLITIEDPVEYELDGLKQVQVNPKAGLTFANGLRSMMRSDPDVIMVGEIRDRETAQIAIESALTGHLVLSTLHTNDAPMTLARLIEMGIEPFLAAAGITCVVAQRLARRLCDCKKEIELSPELLARNGYPGETAPIQAYEPIGCVRCGRTGYKGRVGLYELMMITEEMRELIAEKRPADLIAELAVKSGMRRLREDGLAKVRLGMTSLPEVLRVLGGTS